MNGSLSSRIRPPVHWQKSASTSLFWNTFGEIQNLPEVSPDAENLELQESGKAKLCPECGAILVPYKVGHELPFSLDRCGHCGGIWFEKNEWEALCAWNLHDDLHFIFSKPWQDAVALAARAEQRETRLRQTFGDGSRKETG